MSASPVAVRRISRAPRSSVHESAAEAHLVEDRAHQSRRTFRIEVFRVESFVVGQRTEADVIESLFFETREYGFVILSVGRGNVLRGGDFGEFGIFGEIDAVSRGAVGDAPADDEPVVLFEIYEIGGQEQPRIVPLLRLVVLTGDEACGRQQRCGQRQQFSVCCFHVFLRVGLNVYRLP